MNPAHKIYFHIAWTTLGRRPMINAATRDFLDPYVRRTVVRERAELTALAFLQTHVHMVIRTEARFDLPYLMQVIKGGSSYAASRAPGNVLGLRWERQYAVTTVSPKSLPNVLRYLADQDKHHPGEAVSA